MLNGVDAGLSRYKPSLYECDMQIFVFDRAKSSSSVFIYGEYSGLPNVFDVIYCFVTVGSLIFKADLKNWMPARNGDSMRC